MSYMLEISVHFYMDVHFDYTKKKKYYLMYTYELWLCWGPWLGRWFFWCCSAFLRVQGVKLSKNTQKSFLDYFWLIFYNIFSNLKYYALPSHSYTPWQEATVKSCLMQGLLLEGQWHRLAGFTLSRCTIPVFLFFVLLCLFVL